MWNLLDKFTGWVDVPLTQKGVQEALDAGEKIAHLPIDQIFVSSLIRAQMTAMLAMSKHQSGSSAVIAHEFGQEKQWANHYDSETRAKMIPVYTAWQLNERYYGDLQGLNKQKTVEIHGKEKVQLWRRSYSERPPRGESLEDTAKRTIPFFKSRIEPVLEQGRSVFVCAHGNSLRSIMMVLEALSEEQLLSLELATGVPIIYHYQAGSYTKTC